MLGWYRSLIGLRRHTPGFSDGRLDRVKVRYDEQAGWLVVERGELRVAANLGDAEQKVDLGDVAGTAVLLASHEGIAVEGDVATLPDTVVICGPSA